MVEVRQRFFVVAGITLIQRLLFGSGVEHCDLHFPVPAEEGGGRRKEEGGRRKEEGRLADIKSNNPHLTGGENI